MEDAEKETPVSQQVDLACTLCGEEFLVPSGIYERHLDVVFCPCCGSVDLRLLGVAEREGSRMDGAAA